jgi:hypothetical protein
MFEDADNVGVCVADLARAVAFCERLGFEKAFENERGITTTADDAKLFLFRTRRADPRAAQRGFGLFRNPPSTEASSSRTWTGRTPSSREEG